MKETSTCPKCKGRRQWIIERFRVPSDRPDGSPLAAVLDQPRTNRTLFQAVESVGGFDMYICADCGFSELWAREITGLEPHPEHGVHLRDNTDPNQGPFR